MSKPSFLSKSISALVLVALALGQQAAQAAVWRPAALPGSDAQASPTLDDGWRFYGGTSSINQMNENHTVWGEMCEDWSGSCEVTDKLNAVANLVLPVCEADTQINCLESFAVGTTSSALVNAKLSRQVGGYSLSPVASKGIPKGGLPGIWEAETQNAAGSNLYVVNPRVVMSVKNGAVRFEDFQISVWPISNRTDATKTPVYFRPTDSVRKASVEGMWDVQCAVVDTGYCGQIEDFAAGTVVKVNVRLSNQITGWLKGRVTAPEISSTPLSGGANRYEIQAQPVTVPKLEAKLSETDPEFTSADGRTTIGTSNGEYHVLRADSPTGIQFVNKLAKAANDTAAATETLWYLASISNSQELQRCTPTAGQFIGLVTTNAMAFDGGVPKFASGYFSYNLAGLHFAPDGKTENLGSYDFAIQADVARCLYGFTKAPISATITVTGTSGEQKVAVTQVRESNNWLSLSAQGFTFSENQIKVKINQELPLLPKTVSIAKFSGSTAKLAAAQSRELRAAVTSTTKTAKCTVYYFASKDKKLAQARASAICAAVKKLNPAILTSAESKLTKQKSSSGKVSITLN